MLRRCLGSQTCAAAQWARGSRTHLQRLLLRLEASAKFGALPHRWNINGDTSKGRLSALGRRLDVVHWVVDLAAGHREPQHHVGKRDPIWLALSGHWRRPYWTWAVPVLDMGCARTDERV